MSSVGVVVSLVGAEVPSDDVVVSSVVVAVLSLVGVSSVAAFVSSEVVVS